MVKEAPGSGVRIHIPTILEFGRWKQEKQEFKVILGYIVSSRPL